MAATASTLTSNVTAPVNFVLMKALLSAARKKLPFFNGTLAGELEKSKGSASVKWRRIENLSPTTTALSEITGTAAAFLGRDAVQPTVTDVTAAMAKYGQAILLTEEVDLYNVNSKTVQLMDTLGANAGESLNRLMEAVFAGAAAASTRFSNGSAGGAATVSTITSVITLTDIKWAVNRLNRNSAQLFHAQANGSTNIGTVPVRSSYKGICHVDVEEDVRSITGFIPVEQYGGYTDVDPFEFGSVGGVRWASTEIIPVSTNIVSSSGTGFLRGMVSSGGTNADVYSSYIYGKEAVGSVGLGNMHAASSYEMYDPKKPPAVELIAHAPGTSGIFDMFNEMGSIAWKAFFAGKILNDAWLTRIRTGASNL
jgi:N4-gp56 family major capsid protein